MPIDFRRWISARQIPKPQLEPNACMRRRIISVHSPHSLENETPPMKLRLALIGQGNEWSTRHSPALRMLQDRFEVRAVYHPVAALAEPMAREFRAEALDGFRAMVGRDDIDAVMILESDWYGAAPLMAACESGKAIYCGADVEFDREDEQLLRERVERTGVAFMTEFPRRYAPATLRLKELIATRLGKPRLLFCHRRLTCENGRMTRSLRSLETRSHRELMELVDWCSYIVGDAPGWVQAVQHLPASSDATSDYQILSVGFGDPTLPHPPILAQISCGAYMPAAWHEAIAYRPPAAIQVCCEKGLAFVDLPSTLVWFDDAGRHQEALDTELPVGQQLLTQFHRSVTSLVRKSGGGLEDMFRALHVVRMAHESMEKGVRHRLHFSEK